MEKATEKKTFVMIKKWTDPNSDFIKTGRKKGLASLSRVPVKIINQRDEKAGTFLSERAA